MPVGRSAVSSPSSSRRSRASGSAPPSPTAPSGGHSHAQATPVAARGTAGDGATAAVATSHVHPGSTSSGATDLNGHHIEGVKAQDVAAEVQPDAPLDAATRAALQQQLVVARDTAMRYPTVASAAAAGYRVIGGFGPGSGAHYIGGFGGFGGPF